MHIISKFKDYYDGANNSIGIDRRLVYVRHTTDVAIPLENYESMSDLGRNNHWTPTNKIRKIDGRIVIDIHPILLGVAGKTYHGLRLGIVNHGSTLSKKIPDKYVYDWSEDFEKYYSEKALSGKGRGWRYYGSRSVRVLLKEFLAMEIPIDEYHRHQTPVLQIWDITTSNLRGTVGDLTKNPNLGKLNFATVLDPYTITQEIQMFVGGVLKSNENATVEIPNKNKIEQHGFDFKWSFRKHRDDPKV